MRSYLLLFIILLLFGCSGEDETDFTGTWEVVEMRWGNEILPPDQGEYLITLTEDQKVQTADQSGNWEFDKESKILSINFDQSSSKPVKWQISFQNDTMTWTDASADGRDMTLKLIKQGESPTSQNPAPSPDEPTSNEGETDTSGKTPPSTPDKKAEQPVAKKDTVHSGNNITIRQANIESFEIFIAESFPVQVHVRVKGYLGDGCTTIHKTEHFRKNDTFIINILTQRPKDAICTREIKNFDQKIKLEVEGLKAGTYKVNVNGKVKEFILYTDNKL